VAEAHRTHLEAARTFAGLVANRLNLEPPVDVLGVLARYADVQHDDIPGTCDALLISRPGKRPLVILEAEHRGRERERFSVAHELGHILMPWQRGTVFCHTDGEFSELDGAVQDIESDANQFAAELLLPRAWLRARVAGPQNLAGALHDAMRAAGVSLPVAVIGAASCVEGPGFVATTSDEGTVDFVAGLDGEGRSRSRTPRVGAPLALREYKEAGSDVHQIALQRRTLWVVRYSVETELGAVSRGANEIRAELLGGRPHEEAERLRMRIDGILGAANGADGKVAMSAADLYRIFVARFLHVDDLREVRSHKAFDEYLRAKAIEFFARRRA
jgi:hypothetical protein